jgi:hypothetical protein
LSRVGLSLLGGVQSVADIAPHFAREAAHVTGRSDPYIIRVYVYVYMMYRGYGDEAGHREATPTSGLRLRI